MDLEALRRLTGGDQAFQEDIVTTFITTGKTALQAIEQALASKNIDELSRTVHKLKGNSGSIFALDLNRAAERVEAAVHDGQSIEALTDQLRREIIRAIDFLRTCVA